MARAASATLPHFQPPSPPASLAGMRLLTEPKQNPAPKPDDALDRARREAVAEAEARFAAIRAADLGDYERRLAEREREFNAKTAAIITERLAATVAEIEARLAAEVARALSRFLAGAIRERAVAELVDTVSALLGRKNGASLRVSGPEALVEALRARLANSGAAIAFVADEGAPDVTVCVNETTVRTAIAEWTARLAAAGEGGDV